MHVNSVTISNFRNYSTASVRLDKGKTILIGENAQGKSNFLEVLELAASGKSSRTSADAEMIRWGENHLKVEIDFVAQGFEKTISIFYRKKPGAGPGALERSIKINGIQQRSAKSLLGQLITVSFQSHDLNLLRGGPKFRRDWLDSVIVRLRPVFQTTFTNYQKVVVQRNRLLKTLFEKGKVTVTDQDQLKTWDTQLAKYGTMVIRERTKLLKELIPVAIENQKHISGRKEELSANYVFRASGGQAEEFGDEIDGSTKPVQSDQLATCPEEEINDLILKLARENRFDEIRRKQTLVGPHRDDITFTLNGASAVSFASQGQQRSLVLSLKLSELSRITESLKEPPVLLLDDVLAELDVPRQGFLMSAVNGSVQTVVTTTHLTSFDPKWLDGAVVLEVKSGQIGKT